MKRKLRFKIGDRVCPNIYAPNSWGTIISLSKHACTLQMDSGREMNCVLLQWLFVDGDVSELHRVTLKDPKK